MPARGLNDLIHAAERENAKWRLRRGLFLVIMATWLLALLFFTRLPFGLWRYVDVTFSLLMLIVGPHGLRLLTGLARTHERIIRDLCSSDSPYVLGPLLETLPAAVTSSTYSTYLTSGVHNTDAKDIIKQMTRALLRLLPDVSEYDYRRLSSGQHLQLQRLMRWANTDPELAETVLKTVLRVGDAGAAPEVARLAALNGRSPNARRLAQFARECLPRVTGRAA